VWRQGRTSRLALRLYGTQLLFFGLHRPGWAVAAIAALWAAIAATMAAFRRHPAARSG